MPRGVLLSDEEREAVRWQIFAAATRLFLQQGFHETTMRQIAKALGMGKSTLYDYFPTKDDLLLYFVEQEMVVLNRTAAAIATQELDALEKLRRLLRAHFDYLSANREMAALLTREVSRLGSASTRQVLERRLEYRRIMQDIIQQGIDEGTFRPVDPALAASALHSLITMPFYDWLRRKEGGGVEMMADTLVDLFVHGVQVR
jgi:AcrR family transcriptional regulator